MTLESIVFLRALAVLVRHTVAHGQAVFVTDKSADELDLMADLIEVAGEILYERQLSPEQIEMKRRGGHSALDEPVEIIPADIAHGFLFLSQVLPGRAAECAELAALSDYWLSAKKWKPSMDGSWAGTLAVWRYVAYGSREGFGLGQPVQMLLRESKRWRCRDVEALVAKYRYEYLEVLHGSEPKL